MADYQFTRRFNTLGYGVVYFLLAVVACLFFVAAIRNSVFGLFGFLFALVAVGGFFSIARGENAGVELTAESLTWWKTGAFAMRRSVKLSDLRSIQYRRQDDDVVYLNLRDKQTIRVDNRCIGNLCELIREIQVRCPDLRIACTLGPECKSEG